MEKQPDEPEDFTNEPLPSMSEPMEVQDAVASTLATPFAQLIIAASKSKAQKQREYRQRIAASRTPAQAAAARKSKNERQRNNRLRQAANLTIASGSLKAKTTSSYRSGEESNNVQTRSQRQHAQQQSTTTADQPDEHVNLTNEPLFPAIPVLMEVQEAVASTSATPFAEPITAAPKTRAQIQREYRQRIAASKTPAQVAAAREARNIRDRNNRLRQAANLDIASGSLEATTTYSSRSGQSVLLKCCGKMVAGDPALNTVHITQRQFPDQQRQTLATKPAETTVQPSTSSDQIEVQAQSTWNTKWASSIMRFKSTFLDNDFGYACSVCDRLWFRNDLEPITAAQLKEHGALDALAGPSRVSRTAVRQSEPDSAGTSSNPHDSLSTEQCRFCGEFNADCVRVSSEKPYLVHNRTAITLNGLSVDLDFSTLPNAVCPHCDEKLHDIYNFVNQVKEAQHNLINVEANREEIDIKTEAYSPTLVDDKEGLLHLVTVGETEFVKPVFTHKRKNDSELTKPRDKLQKKLKVTEKNVELFIDVKEEVDMDENSEDQMENSEFSDTGTDVKPTELELNSALRNTFSDSFS